VTEPLFGCAVLARLDRRLEGLAWGWRLVPSVLVKVGCSPRGFQPRWPGAAIEEGFAGAGVEGDAALGVPAGILRLCSTGVGVDSLDTSGGRIHKCKTFRNDRRRPRVSLDSLRSMLT
jgi:hypothetical protein